MSVVKRHYRSPAREARAARTRTAIVDATGRLLRSGDLGSTTMEAIATEAGVAVQTVYAAFGSKPGILLALLERLEADADPDRLASDLATGHSPREQLGALVAYHRRLFERGADVIAASVGSVATDPDIADHVRTGHDRRRAAQARIVRRWHRDGALRSGLGVGEATDVLWAMTSPDLYLLHTRGSGWAPARYQRWLTDMLERSLFGA